MRKTPVFTRPTFDQALDFWKELLRARGLPSECLWLFEENLCFEADGGKELALKYQVRFTPPPPDAERIVYQQFAACEEPVVFYCIGQSQGKSLCVMLCDPWFRAKTEAEKFIWKEEWFMLFYPGNGQEVEEITQSGRWKLRVVKKRPLHDLDFSMTLQAVHETLAHGRILSTYEHYALKFLHAWKKFQEPRPRKNGLDNPNPAL